MVVCALVAKQHSLPCRMETEAKEKRPRKFAERPPNKISPIRLADAPVREKHGPEGDALEGNPSSNRGGEHRERRKTGGEGDKNRTDRFRNERMEHVPRRLRDKPRDRQGEEGEERQLRDQRGQERRPKDEEHGPKDVSEKDRHFSADQPGPENTGMYRGSPTCHHGSVFDL